MSQLHNRRLKQLQASLKSDQAYLLVNPHDIFYFSGFVTLVPEEREAFLLVSYKSVHLIYASFSPLPEDLGKIKTHPGTDPQRLVAHLQLIQKQNGWQTLCLDETKMSVSEYKALQKLSHCQLDALDLKLPWRIRAIKDETEITALKRASQIASQAFEELQPQIKTGMTELEVQDLLESLMRKLGAKGPAFPTIVAFGAHAALPHYQPGETVLKAETSILIDFGATFDHYRSDITRTWWHGNQPSAEFLKIEAIVKQAYDQVLHVATEKPLSHLSAGDLDQAARTHIQAAGYGSQFIHTTGHGVGLDIHEPPSISSQNPTFLQPGMVITVEPGIYLEGKFGYRHENTVLVTAEGLKELTIR